MEQWEGPGLWRQFLAVFLTSSVASFLIAGTQYMLALLTFISGQGHRHEGTIVLWFLATHGAPTDYLHLY